MQTAKLTNANTLHRPKEPFVTPARHGFEAGDESLVEILSKPINHRISQLSPVPPPDETERVLALIRSRE
jgi:hypothetical protein